MHVSFTWVPLSPPSLSIAVQLNQDKGETQRKSRKEKRSSRRHQVARMNVVRRAFFFVRMVPTKPFHDFRPKLTAKILHRKAGFNSGTPLQILEDHNHRKKACFYIQSNDDWNSPRGVVLCEQVVFSVLCQLGRNHDVYFRLLIKTSTWSLFISLSVKWFSLQLETHDTRKGISAKDFLMTISKVGGLDLCFHSTKERRTVLHAGSNEPKFDNWNFIH